MSKTKEFDREIGDHCKRTYYQCSRSDLLKAQKKLNSEVMSAKKALEKASEVRAKANARHHTAAEHFERLYKYRAYVDALLAPPSYDVLFDGSNAHLLNGDAFEEPTP